MRVVSPRDLLAGDELLAFGAGDVRTLVAMARAALAAGVGRIIRAVAMPPGVPAVELLLWPCFGSLDGERAFCVADTALLVVTRRQGGVG